MPSMKEPERHYLDQARGMFEPPVVQFYVFRSEAPHAMNGRLCEIVDWTGLDETSTEPTFMVVFNNGRRVRAFSNELSPWYVAR